MGESVSTRINGRLGISWTVTSTKTYCSIGVTLCNIVIDVINVKVLEDYKLYLQFEDGFESVVDINEIISFDGIFQPLQNKAFFRRVFVNS